MTRRRLEAYGSSPEEVADAKKDWMERMVAEDNMGLKTLKPEWWITRNSVYWHRDTNAGAFLQLGIMVTGLLSLGLRGVAVLPVLLVVERLMLGSPIQKRRAVGVSGISSIISGFLIAGHLYGSVKEWLPILIGWYGATSNAVTAVIWQDHNIAHVDGHLMPTIVGLVIGLFLFHNGLK